MSLLLNGAKTLTIAGTEMSCLELYTGEAYTLPFTITDSLGNPVNCTGWTLSIAAKFYTADTVTYTSNTNVTLGNLNLTSPQPSSGGYPTLSAVFTTPASGIGYIYVPTTLTGSPSLNLSLANNADNSTLIILTLRIQRTDVLSGQLDISREPIGLIVRYQ